MPSPSASRDRSLPAKVVQGIGVVIAVAAGAAGTFEPHANAEVLVALIALSSGMVFGGGFVRVGQVMVRSMQSLTDEDEQ